MTSPSRDVLAHSFAQACEARPQEFSDERFSVGGAAVRARVAGTDVAHLLRRALAPLANADVDESLTLELWDEEATGVGLPELPGRDDEIERPGPAGERLGVSRDGRHVRFWGPDFEIRMDRDEGHAVGWLRGERHLSSWHRARPLQTLFLPWMASRGATSVHAAMVACEGAGVLLAGAPHSGKSTSTAACGAAGLDLLGDDAIALEVRDGRALGHCVHAAVKLRSEGLHRHPNLEGRTHTCGPPWQGEAVAFLGEVYPGQVVASAELAALAFPVLGEQPATSFAPMPASQAMRLLTGCMLSVEPGNVAAAFETIGAVLDCVPSYRVLLGSDTAGIADGIRALLAHAGAERSLSALADGLPTP